MNTTRELLARADITVPDELAADLDIPVLSGMQRQGDVLIRPIPPVAPGALIPREGVTVVRGEATGNTHLLYADGPAYWQPATEPLILGWLTISAGSTAHLIHTDEHGANSVAPGCYELRGKREQAAEIRRVAD